MKFGKTMTTTILMAGMFSALLPGAIAQDHHDDDGHGGIGAGKGSLIGGGAGAGIGALAGGGKGALIGGALGAGGGALVGNANAKRRHRRYRQRSYNHRHHSRHRSYNR